MTEREQPIPNKAELTPKRVFDLSNLDTKLEVLRQIAYDELEPGDKIIGIANWSDITQIKDIIIYKIVNAFDTGPNIKHNLKNEVDIEKAFQLKDKAKGFRGKSKNFEIKILPTDISFMRPGKRTISDPKLARTFELTRRLSSDVLMGKSQLASAACTISLSFASTSNKSNLEKIHHFNATVAIKDLDSQALDIINKRRTSSAAFGRTIDTRHSSGPRNPR